MIETLIPVILWIASISAGIVAGVYFAFSGFIMRSFNQLGSLQATDSMNAINEVILRSWFMPLFFGSTLLYAVLAAIAVFKGDLDGRWLLFFAGSIYVAGMFLCTVVFNVPLNNRLANASDDSAKSKFWQHYFRHWTRWNHLRSVSSIATQILSIQYLVNYS